MARKIQFVHYLYDNASVDENVEGFEYAFNNQRTLTSTPDLGDVEYDAAVKAVDKFYTKRPFYEIGLRIELDVDSGEWSILGTL